MLNYSLYKPFSFKVTCHASITTKSNHKTVITQLIQGLEFRYITFF